MNNRVWVSATEVASYGYCPEAWRLDQGLKLEPSNLSELQQGIARHDDWERAEKRSSGFVRAALWLFALAVAVCVVYRMVGGA